MSTFAIITNSIRRDLKLVEKSLRASLSQAAVEKVVFVDQNEIPLLLSADLISSPKLKIMHIQVPAVSQARNLAVYPPVDWLIFCDDDGYMEDGYLDLLKGLILVYPDTEIFCGSIRRIDNGDFYSQRHAIGGDMKYFWNTKLLMGSNFCVRRSVFEDLGKFDEQFGAGAKFGSSEETDFAWNAFFSHRKMRYAPELTVFHVPPFAGDANTEVAKAHRYGVGKGALVSKWLLKKKHPLVLLEIAEMLVYPVLRTPYDLIKFDLGRVKINFSTFMGRVRGLKRYFV